MEKNKISILILFLLLFTLSFDAVSQIKDVPVVKLFEKDYYKYEIKKQETLFSICKKFETTEAEILNMNPFIIDGLKVGQTLMIPVKITKISTEKEIVISKDASSIKMLSKDKKRKKSAEKSLDIPRITVFLPFASATPGTNDKYIEFYEGLLMAVDSLKSLGLSFEVQALEAGTETDYIKHAIIAGKLKETDYCIGGSTPEQISILAEWAKKNQRILILPFHSRIPELDNNSFIFQTNTPHNFLYEKLSDYCVKRMRNSNIIFLNSGRDESDVQTILIPRIKSKLKKLGISYTEADDDEQLESLSNALNDNQVNNIIPTSLTFNETNQLVTRLGAFLNANPGKRISLFGYPDWQAMSKSYQKRLYELDTYIYSNFYVDQQQQNVRNFQIKFAETFGNSMLNSYPKFGMMGYDIAAWFIPRMVFEKSDNMDHIPVISPLQNEFKFNSNNAIDGSFNQVFYIVHYTRDNTVEVLPLQ